jgi:hypothetical protein
MGERFTEVDFGEVFEEVFVTIYVHEIFPKFGEHYSEAGRRCLIPDESDGRFKFEYAQLERIRYYQNANGEVQKIFTWGLTDPTEHNCYSDVSDVSSSDESDAPTSYEEAIKQGDERANRKVVKWMKKYEAKGATRSGNSNNCAIAQRSPTPTSTHRGWPACITPKPGPPPAQDLDVNSHGITSWTAPISQYDIENGFAACTAIACTVRVLGRDAITVDHAV